MHSAPSMEATEREAMVNKEERHHSPVLFLPSRERLTGDHRNICVNPGANRWHPRKHRMGMGVGGVRAGQEG